jgi:hypothetical protein
MSAASFLPWAFLWIAGAGIRPRVGLLRWVFPLAGVALLVLQRDESPGWRLLAASLLFLYLMKAAVVSGARQRPRGMDLALFFTVWPGMKPEELTKRAAADDDAGVRFARGLVLTLLGIAAVVLLALGIGVLPQIVTGWLGIFAILLTIHFGVSELLTAALRFSGRPVKPLFDLPLASKSLREFWTSRWNRPFVDMNRSLFMPGLTRRFGMKGAVVGSFLISGLLHEMAISYPAGAGWGGPMLYFTLQAFLVLLEKQMKIASRVFTWCAILLPLPLLFGSAFRETFILGGLELLAGVLTSQPLKWWLGALLLLVGLAHFLVPIASFQVPTRLRWREELVHLSAFNRKLMWTFGGYTLLAILSFGVLTLAFRESFVRGEPVALGLAAYILIFWGGRLLIDLFYYRSEDWPQGPQFVAGHALLNALITFLASGYAAVLLYHFSLR